MREHPLHRIARRSQQMHKVGHLMHGEQVDPVGKLADLTLRFRRLGEENDARMIEQRERGAVRVGDRIHHQDVGDTLRRKPDFLHDRRADGLDVGRRALRPGLVLRRVVDAEMRRGDGAPMRGGTLSQRR